MKPILCSLVCPCYDSKKGIKPLLESLAKQDCDFGYEVVFVIDSNGDGLEDYLPSLHLPYIRVIVNEERLGIVPSRMKGIAAAMGKYVGFVDADDWLEPNFFSLMVGALEKDGSDAVDCGFYVNSISGKQMKYPFRHRHHVYDDLHANKMLLGDWYMRGFLWTKMFKKEILLSYPMILLPKNHLFEDMAYAFSCFQKCKKVSYIKPALYHYLEAPSGTATSKPNPNRALEHLESFACVRAYAHTINNKSLIDVVRHSYWRMVFSLGYDISLSKKAGATKSHIKQVKKELKYLKKKELILEGTLYESCVKASNLYDEIK